MEFKEFLHPHTESSKVRTPEKVLADLLLKNINNFNDIDREYVRDYALGNWLTPNEISEVEWVIGEWWRKNFGFNFSNVARRNSVLRKVFLEKSDTISSKDAMLELERFDATPEEKQNLKKIIIKEFPDEVQGIELVFGFPEYARTQMVLREKKNEGEDAEKVKNELLEVGEYLFTMVNFVQANNRDKEFLKIYWGTLREIAEKNGATNIFETMKSGVLAHIAGHEIMEELGVRPRSSKPREDVFFGIDEFGRKGEVIQYKASKNLNVLMGTIDEENGEFRYGVFENSANIKYITSLKVKLRKNLRSGAVVNNTFYILEIPPQIYDAVTGKVRSEKIEEIKSQGIKKVEDYTNEQVLHKENVMRGQIEHETKTKYGKDNKVFDETRDKYQLTKGHLELLLKQALLCHVKEFPAQNKKKLLGFIFDRVEKKDEKEVETLVREFWKKIPDAPSFDNKEAVGDYLFRRYLRDVDYGWKKRDMAGGAGVSGGK